MLERKTGYLQMGKLARHCAADATGVEFYFATPYHSWGRGTNEDTNGLIRQYLPKRTSMAHIDQSDLDAIVHKLKTRPRKRLGYRTPEEC